MCVLLIMLYLTMLLLPRSSYATTPLLNQKICGFLRVIVYKHIFPSCTIHLLPMVTLYKIIPVYYVTIRPWQLGDCPLHSVPHVMGGGLAWPWLYDLNRGHSGHSFSNFVQLGIKTINGIVSQDFQPSVIFDKHLPLATSFSPKIYSAMAAKWPKYAPFTSPKTPLSHANQIYLKSCGVATSPRQTLRFR